MILSNQDRSKPRRISTKTTTILGVVLIVVVFALPVIPMTYYLPYREEVPILAFIVQTNVLVNLTDIALEGGDYKFWHVQIEDYKMADFSLESSESVDAAMMALDEFEAFQDTMSVDQALVSVLDADSINLEYRVPVTETYFFVIYNHHDGSIGEAIDTTINSVTVTESWEEESVDFVIEEGVRNMTTAVTLWQLITGSTPVF
jgi:hypothetical protein